MLRRLDRQLSLFGFFTQPIIQLGNVQQEPPHDVNNKSHSARLSNINFPHEKIPTEYIDYIFEYDIMEEPVLLDGHHIMDYHNLKKWWDKSGRHHINPVTNNPLVSLQHLTDLKNNIESFVKEQEHLSEKTLKDFEEKIQLIKQKREAANAERIKHIEEHTKKRKELSIKIEHGLEGIDENTLKILLTQLDKIDKKIKKLHLGNAYHNDPYHLRQRIQQLMSKREHRHLSEKDEVKLNVLLHQLQSILQQKPNFYSRFQYHLSSSNASHEAGILAILEQPERIAAHHSLKDF